MAHMHGRADIPATSLQAMARRYRSKQQSKSCAQSLRLSEIDRIAAGALSQWISIGKIQTCFATTRASTSSRHTAMIERKAIIASIGAAIMVAAFCSPHASATAPVIAAAIQSREPSVSAPVHIRPVVFRHTAHIGHRHHGHRHHRHHRH